MTPEQFQRVKELFSELEPLPAPDRARRLDERCDDAAVRAEVEQLLDQDADTQSHFSQVTRQVQRILSAEANHAVAADDDAVHGDALDAPEGRPDSLIGGRVACYEIDDVLGQGGMGVVYLAHDVRLGRKAALKAIRPGAGDDRALVERLRREARMLASLSHPNVATVYGLEESDGTSFIAMEFIDGPTLSQRIGRTGMSIADALQCCEQVAAGLEAAHDRGVIHRDLKPCNVMFTSDGTAKVLDFGLGRAPARIAREAASDAGSRAPLTRQGWVFGTPAYMSPEQACGEPLDERSDIYSFGSVLFRCLTGRPAFEGETDRELIEAILTRDPDWSKLPAKLPPPVVGLLKRCLQKDRSDRYRHIGDVRLDLRDARAARGWERGDTRPAGSGAALRYLSWAVAIVALALGAWQFAVGRRASRSLAPARRFDLALPEESVQADLERVQLALSRDGRELVVACKTKDGQALWSRSHSDGLWRRVEQADGGHRPFFSADGQWVGFFRAGQLFKRRLSAQGESIRLAAVTNWYGAGWADDGSLVYCAAWGDPLQKLAPDSSSPQAATRLDTGRGEISHLCPAVVPGTRWVLYNVWTGGEQCDVHATQLDTGAEHVVVSNASCPRVAETPKGPYLLYERASTVFAVGFDYDRATTRGGEAAIAEGVMNDGTRFAAYFDVAADGTLAYFPGSSFAEESRFSYVNADSSTTPLNDDRMSFCEPVFFPGGKKLAVLVKGKVYRGLVYDLERGTREFLVTGGDTLSMAVSPDASVLACTVNRDGGYGIDLISLKDGRRIGRIVQPGADYESDLVWSNDGGLLAFSMSPHEGTPNDVWLVEPRVGAQPRALVHTTGSDTKPAISPDGKWVAYTSDVSGRAEVYLVACPDGHTTRQVSFGGGARPVWSRDGAALYFVGPQGLVSVPIAPDGSVTGQPKVVYDKPFGQSDPIAREYTLAPDGRPLIVEPSERRPTVSRINVITNWHQLLP